MRGLVPPDEFIRVAEDSGLIEAIGDWVLGAALAQATQWSDQGLGPLRVAVNVSGRQLLYNHLSQSIAAALSRHPRMARNITFECEITENILFSYERCTEAFAGLKDQGMSIAIDDFGTGYSSLSRLKHLAVDTLKIDKAFLCNIPHAADNRAITAAIIALAHSLRLKVIAEGVENREQLDFLREHACDEAQGFLISAALDAAAMTALLRRRQPCQAPELQH